MAKDPFIVGSIDQQSTVGGTNTLRGEGAPEEPAGESEFIAVQLRNVVVPPRYKAIAT